MTADVTFRLKNNLSPAATSSVIAVSLTNTLNFEKFTDNCNGNTLAPGAECQIVVRAKASGNVSYAGELRIAANNSPFAMLDGVANNFPGCNAGGNAPGGFYVGCGIGGYDLVVTPSGCTGGMTNPTCAGGADTLTAPGMVGSHAHASGCCTSANGQQNSANVMAYAQNALTSYPAVGFCDGLIYQGFSDWFLPSTSEMISYFYPNRVAVGWTSAAYFTANEQAGSPGYWGYMTALGAASATSSPGQSLNIRCMRWTPAKAVTPVVDTTPMDMVFAPSYGGAAQTRTSNTVTVYGITQNVTVSISGGTAAQYSVNGGAYTSANSTVSNGAQITLQATSPIAGQESVVTLNVGSGTYNWQVRTPGNNAIRVFTTSTTTNGAMGGAGGADAQCTARASAAGLPGAWVAVLGTGVDGSYSLNSRLPWNWTSLKNLNGVGATVATSLGDFLDGTISAPMNYSEAGVPIASIVWTGTNALGQTNGNCSSWTAPASSGNSFGDSSAVTGGGYLYVGGGNCGAAYRLLCMESNQAGADLDPDPANIGPAVVYASGAVGQSRSITLTGITDAITVTLNPSAGSGNIIKNGVPVNALTTTAGLNENLIFTLTAPTVLGTKNTATISLGPDNYDWWVGYADSSKTAKAFTAYKSNGSHGGLAGADAICNAAAATSTFGLSSDWKAILSDSTTHAADRIPWNWGILKTVTGTTIVDNGYVDLMDGSLDASMGINQNGNAVNHTVWTGSNRYGMSLTYSGPGPSGYCNNWTSGSNYGGGMVVGFSSSTGSTWLENSTSWCGGDSAYAKHLYCIENLENTTDTIPNSFTLDYAIQVPASSRQTSSSVMISGMSTGATQTMSVSATGGNPRMKVNGGAEVSSASIQNGDTVVFLMDAPAIASTSNKMTITASTMSAFWRVWTGDTTGTAVKRIFVTSNVHRPDGFGGVTGADSRCQARAAAIPLGGTWKAILSGIAENDWAVNRIGYNWSELRLVDNSTTVAFAGGLWGGSPLLSPIIKNESNVVQSGSTTITNTDQRGFASTTVSGSQNCGNWTTYFPYVNFYVGNTAQSSSPQWVNSVQYCDPGCSCSYNLYCIEQ